MIEWNSPQQAQRFVDFYADPILRLCRTYSLSREDAQDICQDIFLKLLERGQQFENLDHERAYLFRMAINACKNLLKSPGRTRVVPIDQAERISAPSTTQDALLEQIRALPQHYGVVVYLFYYEGYSLDEIAKLCSCTPAAARKRLSRSRKLLAKELGVAMV
ncbi:MAG: RNA polymerase sigma factor [Lawsonibacter sp.]|jgi:RNA polymerase sigma factor (sigma-70 family)